MKYTKYSKYVADLADEMSMEDLLNALSDYLLESGFQNDSMYFQQMDEHSLDALRQAIQQALEMGDFLEFFEADDGEGGGGEAVLAGVLSGAGFALGGGAAGGMGGVGAIGGELCF